MIVLTLLCPWQVERVKAAAPACRAVRASSPAEARAVLMTQPVDVLVLDPGLESGVRHGTPSPGADFLALGAEHPDVPILFYVANAATALRVIARFPTRQPCEALVAGVDDDPRSLAEALESVLSASLSAALVRRLGPALTDGRPALARALRAVFSQPSVFGTVRDVADAAFMSRRTLDRCLKQHGIVTSAKLLDAGRALAAARRECNRPSHNEWLRLGATRTIRGLYDDLGALKASELVDRFSARLQRRTADESGHVAGRHPGSERDRGRCSQEVLITGSPAFRPEQRSELPPADIRRRAR